MNKINTNIQSHIKPDIIQTILLLPSQKTEKPYYLLHTTEITKQNRTPI